MPIPLFLVESNNNAGSIWLFILTIVIVLAAIVGSFLLVKSIRILRYFFMMTGAAGFLFLSIYALISYNIYNEAWKRDLIDAGWIVWSQHWSMTMYPLYFLVLLAGSFSLVFLYIFADRAFDVDYISVRTDVHLENEYSWFKPTTIVVEEVEKEHTYFIKVLIFGFGLGIIVPGLTDFIVGIFNTNRTHYPIFYTICIVYGVIASLIVTFLFVRTLLRTIRSRM